MPIQELNLPPEATAAFTAANPPKKLAVISLGKSGTTWMRKLCSTLPGYKSFDMEGNGANGTRAFELDLIKEGEVYHGHLLHTPETVSRITDLNIATIYVYRDLRDVIVSEYYHKKFMDPDGVGNLYPFLKTATQEEAFDVDNLNKWSDPAGHYDDVSKWLNVPGIAHVRFEDLRRDPVPILLNAFQKVGFNISRELVEEITSFNSFYNQSGRQPGDESPAAALRKGIIGDWKNYFLGENKEKFKQKYQAYLEQYGYENNALW